MNPAKKTARIAGLYYLLVAISGGFSMMYVPMQIFSGEAASTVRNIMANEFLFRLGFVSGLVCQVAFIFLVLELYALLSGVNKRQASLMVVLVVAAVPLACLNMLNQFAMLILLSGADYLSAFSTAQLNSLVMLFHDLHNHGILIAEIFWGLWLLPFGMLVIKSGFIPKILGALLIMGGVGYLIDFTVRALFPDYAETVSSFATIPLAVSELSMVLWLLIKGVKEIQPAKL